MTLKCDDPISQFAFKFNLRRYTLEITATMFVSYETDYFTVTADGTFGNECTDEGTFLSGSLMFAADLPIPFPVGPAG